MHETPIYDIALLGGGNTALQLAMAFAARPELKQTLLILEARTTYTHDRNWSFWLHETTPFAHRDILRKQWDRWSFSCDGEHAQHTAVDYCYATIASGDFYAKAQRSISEDTRQTLHLGQYVDRVEQHAGHATIHTNHDTFHARSVIDTRQLSNTELQNRAPYFQIFYGYEVAMEHAVFDDTSASIMHDMKPHAQGVSFMYLLPFSAKEALVEYTLFTPNYVAPNTLEAPLKQYIENQFAAQRYHILHQERAVLPMGPLAPTQHTTPGLTRAGSGAGFLKESTGYGFMRNHRWAQATIESLATGTPPQTLHVSKTERFMDRHFIKTLIRFPHHACALFWRMVSRVKPERFVRFMMSDASLIDYLSIIRAMPKMPFILALLRK